VQDPLGSSTLVLGGCGCTEVVAIRGMCVGVAGQLSVTIGYEMASLTVAADFALVNPNWPVSYV